MERMRNIRGPVRQTGRAGTGWNGMEWNGMDETGRNKTGEARLDETRLDETRLYETGLDETGLYETGLDETRRRNKTGETRLDETGLGGAEQVPTLRNVKGKGQDRHGDGSKVNYAQQFGTDNPMYFGPTVFIILLMCGQVRNDLSFKACKSKRLGVKI
jgi:hypothetical protein